MLTILAISYFLLFILFFQSAIDKVINWKENYTWLRDYFSKTFLNRFTKLNLSVIALLELVSALFSVYCFGDIIFNSIRSITCSGEVFYITNIVCSITLLFLFTGQRIAKDYLGAVRIIPYFIFVLVLTCLVYCFFGAGA